MDIKEMLEYLNAYNRTPETEEGIAERERILRECSPEESFKRMVTHLRTLLPKANLLTILRLLK